MQTNRIAHVAALVGEPARTAMLMALMDGRALTARELADVAGITPATASRHLGLLVEAQLLHLAHQGRHRYHRLASPEVARVLEGLMQLAAPPRDGVPRRLAVGPRDAALRMAIDAFAADWRQHCGQIDELVEVFGMVPDDCEHQRWDRMRGLLQSSGWQEVLRIRRLLESLQRRRGHCRVRWR